MFLNVIQKNVYFYLDTQKLIFIFYFRKYSYQYLNEKNKKNISIRTYLYSTANVLLKKYLSIIKMNKLKKYCTHYIFNL